jgi:hypothetical protein
MGIDTKSTPLTMAQAMMHGDHTAAAAAPPRATLGGVIPAGNAPRRDPLGNAESDDLHKEDMGSKCAQMRDAICVTRAKGRLWLNELLSENSTSTHTIAVRERCSERSVRMTVSLAFLSPALVKSAIEGTLPYGVGITQFIEPPLDWNDQLARFR